MASLSQVKLLIYDMRCAEADFRYFFCPIWPKWHIKNAINPQNSVFNSSGFSASAGLSATTPAACAGGGIRICARAVVF